MLQIKFEIKSYFCKIQKIKKKKERKEIAYINLQCTILIFFYKKNMNSTKLNKKKLYKLFDSIELFSFSYNSKLVIKLKVFLQFKLK